VTWSITAREDRSLGNDRPLSIVFPAVVPVALARTIAQGSGGLRGFPRRETLRDRTL
jgi:hypothetical protein